MRTRLTALVSVFFFHSSLAQGSSWTLSDIYQMALAHRPTITAQKLNKSVAEYEKNRALSRVLPKLSAQSESRFQDKVTLAGGTQSFGETYQHTAKITLDQPIFQGGAEYYGLNISEREILIQSQEEEELKLKLYEDLIPSFFNIVLYEKDKLNVQEQERIVERQVDDLRRRSRIGRSKESDVLAAESNLARVRSELALIQGNQITDEKDLLWLTGAARMEKLAFDLDDSFEEIPASWKQDLENRPSIRSLTLQIENSTRRVRAVQGSYLPNVDFQANYYLDRGGILSNSKWDMFLTGTWEFFSGGDTRAAAQIEKLRVRQLELEKLDLLSRLQNDFDRLTEQYAAQRVTVEKLKTAKEFAQKNADFQKRDYERGLVSNLEYLRSLDDYLVIRRALDREATKSITLWHQVHALTGRTP